MTKAKIFKRIAIDDGYITDKSVVVVEKDMELIYQAMDEFAKQQATAFFKWNCKQVDHYLNYLKRVHEADRTQEKDQELDRFENATIELRYMQFIEQQTKSPD